MEARLLHRVVYETPTTVPVEDLIASLRGTAQLAQEVGPILELLIPGLDVRSVTLSVSEVSQASPLREAFAVGLIATYQEKIGAELPPIIHSLFGEDVPKGYDNLVSLIMIVTVFYAGQLFFDQASKAITNTRSKMHYNRMIADIAKMIGRDEAFVRKIIDERYKKSGIRNLLKSASLFFLPSKKQDNSPVLVNDLRLTKEDVAEFPSDAQMKAAIPGPSTKPLENVEIQLHAQDIDRNRQGWAAVVPALSQRRIPMELFPPIVPADIYTREVIHGDLLVESRATAAGQYEPVRVHLVRLRN